MKKTLGLNTKMQLRIKKRVFCLDSQAI